MIRSIKIKNYKSIVDIAFLPGYFNVLIGENGCGKSNILEAIAFGAAAEAKKLDYEFLSSRGIRVANPAFMFSAFNRKTSDTIKLEFKVGRVRHYFDLSIDPNNSKKWIEKNLEAIIKNIDGAYLEIKQRIDRLKHDKKFNLVSNIKMGKQLSNIDLEEDENERVNIGDFQKKAEEFTKAYSRIIEIEKEIQNNIRDFKSFDFNKELSNFLIYSPEHSNLRKFEEAEQIYPLGIKGEGIFQYLKEISKNGNNKIINEIENNLNLLDWYNSINIPEDLLSNEFTLKIKDRYITDPLNYFDQRSTNEGFLYLLFYSVLMVSNDTPNFFSIDNIDNALNPKLCQALINNLAKLAKKHKKQVIVTTHSPAVLDGLNLEDDGQRLFVVRRNDEGHTKISRIYYKPERQMKLSEIWTKGLIGGLPENF